jgi:hypothetical protein
MSNSTIRSNIMDILSNFPDSIGSPGNDWKENRWWLVAGGILAFYVFNVVNETLFTVKAPVVGYRSFFEPSWLLGFRFVRGSAPIIQEGYQKVCIRSFRLYAF